MPLLWCGGEDIDFPNGNIATVVTTASHFRAGLARCALQQSIQTTGVSRSVIFPGGPITTFWMSILVFVATGPTTATRFLGICRSGTEKGIFLGTGTSATKINICTFDGTTLTPIGTELGNSFSGGTQLKIDVHVVNFGISSNIDVYVAGVLVISLTGFDSRITGITDLDSIYFLKCNSVTGISFSEFIVADEDTRNMSLVTMAPNASGTLSQWTGLFSDVNETTTNDITVANTNTVTQDEQFNLLNIPAGTFTVTGVKIAARAASTTGATATKVGLGVKNGANTDTGSLQTPSIGFVTLERLMNQDPTTGPANWVYTDLNGLQLNLRSGS